MKHNYDRIVGTKSVEEHEKADNILEEVHQKDFPDVVMECSAEITKEHQKIVQGVMAYTRTLLASLGIDKPIPKIKFALLDKKKATAANLLGENSSAMFFPMAGAMLIIDSGDLAEFAETFTHEYFHALGYSSAQVKDGSDVGTYRQGLSMYDRNRSGTRYFGKLEEAVVTELSMMVLRSTTGASVGSPEVQAELAHMNTLRDWFNQSNELRQYLGKGYEKTSEQINNLITISHIEKLIPIIKDEAFSDIEKASYIAGFLESSEVDLKTLPYTHERKELWKIINTIAEHEPDLSPNQIFDEFAKAHFSGNYLTIARLIEKTYGEGSFRKLANGSKIVLA